MNTNELNQECEWLAERGRAYATRVNWQRAAFGRASYLTINDAIWCADRIIALRTAEAAQVQGGVL